MTSEVRKVLEKYFTGEQYDEVRGTFIRILFTKQMDKAEAEITTYIDSVVEQKVLDGRIDELENLLDFPADKVLVLVGGRIGELRQQRNRYKQIKGE